MVDRPTHLLTRYRDSLTPRQQEILAMIARGRTNFEIAQDLGMSLDGAKWHVREILAKLNVDSREDAVAEWRRQSRFGARLRVLARALLPMTLFKPVAAGAAVIGVAAAIAVGVVMYRGGGDDAPPASASQTPEATATPDADTSLNEPLPGDGSKGYAYTPEIAFVDHDGIAWLANADGTGKRTVLAGCTGVGSPKSGALTGGLRWSPAGRRLACWKEDLSVFATDVETAEFGEPFGPGECIGPVSGPAFPPGAPGVACETSEGLQVRNLNGAVLRTYPTTTLGEHRWLPDGGLITAAPPEADHGTWKVFAPDGSEVAHIKGAYIGQARQFAVTTDGRKIAYPAEGGLTVLDLQTGETRSLDNKALEGIDWGGGAHIGFALDGSALVLRGYPISALIDATTGEPLSTSGLTTSGRVSPNGRYLVGIVASKEGEPSRMGVADLEAGTLTVVEDSTFQQQGIGLDPHFTWSGDSSRFCWTVEAGAVSAARYCASVHDPVAVAVDKPLSFLSEELGYGDLDIMWEMLSPDLELIAFTIAVPDTTQPWFSVGPVAGGTIAGVDFALSEYAYAWRPDGVVRPD